MEQIQQKIDLFHNLFYVCLAICIICLIVSVIFFFKFDIIDIFNFRTGRSVRKKVRQMEENNARTTPLRRPAGRGSTGGLGRSGNMGHSKKLDNVRKVKLEDIVQAPPSKEEATEVLNHSAMENVTKEMAQNETDQSHGMFKIEKYMIFIHTDEVV